MSNWTYVSGSIGIERSAYKTKLTKEGYIKYYEKGDYEGCAQLYLPYPEEQFKLLETEPMIRTCDTDDEFEKQKAGFRHKIEISSFPIIKRDIEELMKDFSSGESDSIFYMLQEANFHRSSSSQFNSPQTEKIFRKVVMEKFPLWKNCTWKEYDYYIPTDMDWEEHKDGAMLCIHDSIRWCAAKEFYDQLIKFLTILIERDYNFNHGSFSFTDAYSDKYQIDIENSEITVTITNKVTNESRYEYYQMFQYRDLSDPEDYKKRFPSRSSLRKVDKLIDDCWPILEDYFPEETKE